MQHAIPARSMHPCATAFPRCHCSLLNERGLAPPFGLDEPEFSQRGRRMTGHDYVVEGPHIDELECLL